jgi:hypothetical protein
LAAPAKKTCVNVLPVDISLASGTSTNVDIGNRKGNHFVEFPNQRLNQPEENALAHGHRRDYRTNHSAIRIEFSSIFVKFRRQNL